MIKLKELREFHSKEKLLSMKKSLELKESPSKEPSPTIMPLKLKSNTFLKKLKKLLSSMNQLKESSKEFNTYQLRHKLFTIQKGITTLQDKANTSRQVMLKEDIPSLDSKEALQDINKPPPTFHLEALSTTFKEDTQLIEPVTLLPTKVYMDKVESEMLITQDPPLNTSLDQLMAKQHTPLDHHTPLDKPILQDKLTPLGNKVIALDNKVTPLDKLM